MIIRIFKFVAIALLTIARKLNITYNEINIIVYYGIIPFTWCVMLDFIIKMPVFSPFWLILCLSMYLINRKHFSRWCDNFFIKSATFLNSFNFIGWDYNKASVIICVIIPIIIYVILGTFLILT